MESTSGYCASVLPDGPTVTEAIKKQKHKQKTSKKKKKLAVARLVVDISSGAKIAYDGDDAW